MIELGIFPDQTNDAFVAGVYDTPLGVIRIAKVAFASEPQDRAIVIDASSLIIK